MYLMVVTLQYTVYFLVDFIDTLKKTNAAIHWESHLLYVIYSRNLFSVL